MLETPYAGNNDLNREYARACMLDALQRDEAPMISHLLYPQVLDDTVPEERKAGMYAGFAWAAKATVTIVYIDLGISAGMEYGIKKATERGHDIVYRRLFPVIDDVELDPTRP